MAADLDKRKGSTSVNTTTGNKIGAPDVIERRSNTPTRAEQAQMAKYAALMYLDGRMEHEVSAFFRQQYGLTHGTAKKYARLGRDEIARVNDVDLGVLRSQLTMMAMECYRKAEKSGEKLKALQFVASLYPVKAPEKHAVTDSKGDDLEVLSPDQRERHIDAIVAEYRRQQQEAVNEVQGSEENHGDENDSGEDQVDDRDIIDSQFAEPHDPSGDHIDVDLDGYEDDHGLVETDPVEDSSDDGSSDKRSDRDDDYDFSH